MIQTGTGFQNYLQSIHARTEQQKQIFMEKEQARLRTYAMMQQVVGQIQQNRQLAGEYRYRAQEKGLFDPTNISPDNKSFEEQRIANFKKKITDRKTKLQADLDQTIIDAPDSKTAIRQAKRLKKQNDRLTVLDDRLETHKGSERYSKRQEDREWNRYLRQNPVYSREFYDAFSVAQPNDLQEYKAKSDIDKEADLELIEARNEDKNQNALEKKRGDTIEKMVKLNQAAQGDLTVHKLAKDEMNKVIEEAIQRAQNAETEAEILDIFTKMYQLMQKLQNRKVDPGQGWRSDKNQEKRYNKQYGELSALQGKYDDKTIQNERAFNE